MVAATITIIPLLILILGWYLPPLWGWLAVMTLVAFFALLSGRRIVGEWRGALIDERNKVSLSRLQTFLWTVVIVAGFLTAALHNVRTEQTAPLEILLPPELWALLGISVSSLVGSALIKQEKIKASPQLDNAKMMLARALPEAERNDVVEMGDSNQIVVAKDPDHPTIKDRVVARGLLAVNHAKGDSSWFDMFRAEEIGSVGLLDLGKIQMFLFTIILVFSYAAAVGSLLAGADGKIASFPAFDEGAIVLLGISHAAYLGKKTTSSTPTTP